MTLEYIDSLPPLSEVVGYRSYQQILDSMVETVQAARPDWTGAGDDFDMAYQTLRAAASETKISETMMLVTLSALDLSRAQDVYLVYLGVRRGIQQRDGESYGDLRLRIAEGIGGSEAPVPGTTDGIRRSAYQADTQVYDAWPVVRSNGQTVDVYILARGDGDEQKMGSPYGTPTAALIGRVEDYISGPDRQHLSDTYPVSVPTITTYDIEDVVLRLPASYQVAETEIRETLFEDLRKWTRMKPQLQINQGVWAARIRKTIMSLVPVAYEIVSATLPKNMAAAEDTAYLCDMISIGDPVYT